MKREERNHWHYIRKAVRPQDTLYAEIPLSFTDEGKQALHDLLTTEKDFYAVRINWNPIRKEYTILYAPDIKGSRRIPQEGKQIRDIIATLPRTEYWWNGTRKDEED